MDYFNYMVNEMLAREAVRGRVNGHYLETPEAPKRLSPVKRALASSLVRLGLRLDPEVGEGLGGLDLSLAQSEGSN